ncbi:Uncharacterised protein [uncultured archaeon]|nr:Uncharacterised protein [uncultured archaeon]
MRDPLQLIALASGILRAPPESQIHRVRQCSVVVVELDRHRIRATGLGSAECRHDIAGLERAWTGQLQGFGVDVLAAGVAGGIGHPVHSVNGGDGQGGCGLIARSGDGDSAVDGLPVSQVPVQHYLVVACLLGGVEQHELAVQPLQRGIILV